MQGALPWVRCTLRYIGVHLLLALAMGAIQVFFDLNLGSGATAATLAAATIYAATWVVRERKQALSAGEALVLSLCALASTAVVSGLVIGGLLMVFMDQVRDFMAMLDPGTLQYVLQLLAAYLVLLLLLQWALFYAFGRLQYRALRKQHPVAADPSKGDKV
ncbi:MULTISPECIES: ABZJ_00895 family protein [Pseudomonadaceae]|uniref:ABZJ_00895 family protein n=1 Tax=Pseudomonadaceae TaxID=135621 RepID=UPI003002F892